MKEDLFVQKNPLQNTPEGAREDLFVQENPILNTPEKKRGEAPTPGLEWDFKGMGMPDNFSIARKTFWFQLLLYTTYTGFIVGGAVLLWVVVMMAMAIHSRQPSENDRQYVTPPPNEASGMPQEDKNCFVLEGHPDIVTVVAFSPDGLYMITGGGKMGITTPSATKELAPRGADDENVNVMRLGIGAPDEAPESASAEDAPQMTHGLDLTKIREEAGLPPEDEKPGKDAESPAAPDADAGTGVPEESIPASHPTSHSVSLSISRTVSETADMDAVAEAAEEAEEMSEKPQPPEKNGEDATGDAAEDTPEAEETGEDETTDEIGDDDSWQDEETPDAGGELEDITTVVIEPRDITGGTGDSLEGELEDKDPLHEIFNPNKTRQLSTEQEVKENMATASVEPPPGMKAGAKSRQVERPIDVLKLMGNNFRRLLVMMDHYEREAKKRAEEDDIPSIFDDQQDVMEIAQRTDDLQPVVPVPDATEKPLVERPRDVLNLMANKFRRAMLIGNYMRTTGKPWPPKKVFAVVGDDPPPEPTPRPVQALKYLPEIEPAPRHVANIQFRSYKKDENRRTVIEEPKDATERREELEIDVNMLISSTHSPDSSESLQKTAEKIKAATAETAEAAEKSGTSWENTSEVHAFPIVIWDLRTCRPLQILWEHPFPITSISISRGGDQFVSTDLGGNAILWKLTKDDDDKKPVSAMPVVSLEAPEKSQNGGSDGAFSEMKTVSYRRQDGELVSATTSTAVPASAAADKVEKTAAVPSSAAPARARSRVPIWKMVGKIAPHVREEKGLGRVITYYGAAFAPSGKQFVLCGISLAMDVSMNAYGETGVLMLWDIESWSEVTRMHPISHQPSTWFQTLNPVGTYRSVAFTPDGQYLLAGASGFNSGVYWFQASGEGQCMSVDADQPRKERQIFTANMTLESNLISGTSGHESPDAEQLHISVSPDGNRVVSGDEYGRVNFWHFSPVFSRKDRGVFRLATVDVRDAQTRHIRSIIYSGDKRFVMLVGEDSSFRNGRKRTFDYLGNLRIASTGMFRQMMFEVLCAQYSPDKQYLALGCDDHKIRVWKMNDIPLTSPTILSSDIQSAEAESGTGQVSYEQSVDSAKKVMTFKEDTTLGDERTREFEQIKQKVDSRLPGDSLQDPMQSRDAALESHNPLDGRLPRVAEEPIDRRLPRGGEEPLTFPL